MIISQFLIILLILFFLITLIYVYNMSSEYSIKTPKETPTESYKEKCMSLFRKLRYPDQKLVFRPPLKEPPADMLKNFTQNGDLPMRRLWYFDNAYSDSDSLKKNDIKSIVTKEELNIWLDKIRKNLPLGYDDFSLKESMYSYADKLKDKTMVVIGTVSVWIEALSYELGCSKITTLDYTRRSYYDPSKFEWLHVNDYLDEAILNQIIENFDNAASFSSIEHAGLGRFGDQLAPNGDVDAMQQVHCMLKPGSLFFLELPLDTTGVGYIEFNAHRVYGTKRLALMFEGWRVVARNRNIYILQKVGV